MTRHPCRSAAAALFILALSPSAPPAAAQPEPAPTHLVQISLLAAAKTGPDELADLPANTRKAVEDVRQFLPFKSYRLLDTALMRVQRGARTLLTGAEDREYSVAFDIDGRRKPGELLVRGFTVQERLRVAPPPAAGGGDRVAPAAPGSLTVMSSSFSAEVGQTVVVGTSRLNGGDQALMVLFTALP